MEHETDPATNSEEIASSSGRKKAYSGRRLKGAGASLRDEWYEAQLTSGCKITSKSKKDIVKKINETDSWYKLNSLNGWLHLRQQRSKAPLNEPADVEKRASKTAEVDCSNIVNSKKDAAHCPPAILEVDLGSPTESSPSFFGITLGSDAEIEEFAILLGTDAAAMRQGRSLPNSPVSRRAVENSNDNEAGWVEKTESQMSCSRPPDMSNLEQMKLCIPLTPSVHPSNTNGASRAATNTSTPNVESVMPKRITCPHLEPSSYTPHTVDGFLDLFAIHEPMLDTILDALDATSN